MAGASIITHSLGFGNKVFAELILAHEVFDRVADVCVGEHRLTFDATNGEFFFASILTAHADADDFAIFHVDAFDKCTFAYFAAVIFQFGYHFFNQGVGAALEGEHALTHKVGKDNAVGDGWVINVRSVRVGNWLHQKSVHIATPRKKLLKHFACSLRVVVVEIHLAKMRIESLHFFAVYLEVVDQNVGEVFAIKGCPNLHLWVNETNVLELTN